MFQFFKILLGYNFPRIGKECDKNINWGQVNLFWHKNEKKISQNFIFVLEPLRFWQICPSFLLSKFASQIKLMQSLVGISCKSQGLRVPCPRVPCPRVASPKAQGPKISSLRVSGLRVPGLRVTRLRVSGPGSQVLVLDYPFKSSIFRFQENIFNINHLLFGNLIYLTNNVNLRLTR